MVRSGLGKHYSRRQFDANLDAYVEQQEFYARAAATWLVKFESHYYVVTTRFESTLGPWYRDVFDITQKGITKICSFEGKGEGP